MTESGLVLVKVWGGGLLILTFSRHCSCDVTGSRVVIGGCGRLVGGVFAMTAWH